MFGSYVNVPYPVLGDTEHTIQRKERVQSMSHSRGRRIKDLKANPYDDPNVFYMSLEEAKDAIASKYEFLAERYERVKPRRPRPSQG